MIAITKRLAKRVFQRFGVEVHLTRNVQGGATRSWEEKQDAMWRPFLQHRRIRTVIDVGANVGQFATLIHRQYPDAGIISFEPLESCHEQLSAALMAAPRSGIIKAAVGERPGQLTMNRSSFSPCSSLLAGTSMLGEDYPDAAVTDAVEVPVVRLDDALRDMDLEAEVLVKLDVQGFELPAIRGAREVLAKASLVVCEVCYFRRLYVGQPLFDPIYETLKELGFSYVGNAEQHQRRTDGRVVEADAIFERLDD